ncbi:MAG: TonB-dependent receptor [Rhodospirillales bacterium]|nr:TonB-dependent receptor [Rhodospirillales bacterium]
MLTMILPSRNGLRNRLLAASAIAAGFAFPAFAQNAAPADQSTASTGGLEEIVVTAERREEKLRDVPIAVTSFSAATLSSRNITDIRGIQGFAPNVAIVQSPGYQTEADIAVRGGVTINPAPYWDPTVGLYIDGVYIPKAIGNVTDMADIDHVEVLRGPQGTLYGRNSLGGAINIVTQKPTGQLEGYITAGAGNYGSTQVRGNLNLPKIGIFSIALSGVMQGHDGYINTVSDPLHSPLASPSWLGKLDSVNGRSGRIAIRADVTDDITLDYAFDISYQKDTPNYSQLTRVGAGNIFDPTSPVYLGIPLASYIQHSPGPSNAATINGGFNGSRVFEIANVRAHSLTATWDVSDELTLKSISGLRWIDWSNNLDLDGSPLLVAGTELFTHYHSASEELQASGQIDRFHYTVGAFYFEDGGYTQNPQEFFLGGVVFNSQYGYATQNYAFYGQVDYNPPVLDDKLTVTFGLRYNNETKFGSRFETGGTAFAPLTVLIPYESATKNYDSATPMAVLKYAVTDDINVYAKFAQGFKSGGFNGEAPSAAEAVTPFLPESVDEYEVGLKTRWLDGRLNVNVAGFYDVHSDLQLSVFTATGAAASVVRNAGSADISGVEFDIQALPVSWLSLTGAVGYLNTAYNTFINNGINVANDRAFPYAPQFTASMSADATLMDNDIGRLHFIVDYRHSDAYYEYPYSFNPAAGPEGFAGSTKASPQNIFDARLRLTNIDVPDGTVDIEMWGKNIFNDKYRINGIDFGPGFGNMTISYYGDPPTFGGDVTYHFGKHEEAPAETAAYAAPPVVAPAPSVPKSYLVFFDFNKSDLTPQAVTIVDQAAHNAGPAGVTKLEVTGHTDTVGSDAYNMRLSRRRAESVAAQLEKNGVPSSEIEIIAKGKRDPLVPTADGVKEPQNRRVQIVYEGGATS